MEANRGNTTSKSFALASLGVSTLIFAFCLTKLRSPDSVISQIGFGYSVFFLITGLLFVCGVKSLDISRSRLFFISAMLLASYVGIFIGGLYSNDDILFLGLTIKYTFFLLFIFLITRLIKRTTGFFEVLLAGVCLNACLIALHTILSKFIVLPVADDTLGINFNHFFYLSGRLPTVFGEPSFLGVFTIFTGHVLYNCENRIRLSTLMSVGLLLSLANLLARSFICSFASLYIILLLGLIVQQRLSMQELHFKNLRIARKFRLNLRVVIPLFLVLLISVFFYVGLADYLIPRIQSVFSNTDESSNARIDSALYFLQNMFKISHFGGSGLKDKSDVALITGGAILTSHGGLLLVVSYLTLFFLYLEKNICWLVSVATVLFLVGEPYNPYLALIVGLLIGSSGSRVQRHAFLRR